MLKNFADRKKQLKVTKITDNCNSTNPKKKSQIKVAASVDRTNICSMCIVSVINIRMAYSHKFNHIVCNLFQFVAAAVIAVVVYVSMSKFMESCAAKAEFK